MNKAPEETSSPNMPVDSAMGPLEGVRVLDLSRVLAGPYCTMTLADLGADVIKVEHPPIGDETRTWGPPFAGEFSSYFLSVNRNKRSVGLDISKPGGREALLDLLSQSQILVENFRPTSRSKLQLDPDQIRRSHPGIVHCHFYAYTPDGLGSEYPGYDLSIQAESGLMSITGERDGAPTKVGVALVDVCAGMHAATAILAAMLRRERTGQGEYVEIGLLDVAVASLVNVVQGHLVSGERPLRYGNAHPNIVPYRDFQTKDLPMVVAAGNSHQWTALCAALDLEIWGKDPSFATNDARVRNRQEVERTLQRAFARTSPSALDPAPAQSRRAGRPRQRHRRGVTRLPRPAIRYGFDAGGHSLFRSIATPIRSSTCRLSVASPQAGRAHRRGAKHGCRLRRGQDRQASA